MAAGQEEGVDSLNTVLYRNTLKKGTRGVGQTEGGLGSQGSIPSLYDTTGTDGWTNRWKGGPPRTQGFLGRVPPRGRLRRDTTTFSGPDPNRSEPVYQFEETRSERSRHFTLPVV